MTLLRPITVHYPSDWLVPVHPAYEIVETDCQRWLRDLGVLVDERGTQKFQSLHVGWYGGSPFSFAPLDRLTTITRFLTLWIFHDDGVEGVGEEPALTLGAAVRGEPREFPGGSPVMRGWWNLGCEFREVMSERWLANHAKRFADWVRSLDHEARLVSRARRTKQQPTVDEHISVRLISGGMIPTVDLVEYALARELGEEVLADPDRLEAERLAALLSIITNDLCGVTKDIRNGWINLVLAVAQEKAIPLADAFEQVACMHDAYVADFAAVGDRLVHRHGAAARPWVEGLRSVMAGFARWHLAAPRYNAMHELPDGSVVELLLGNSRSQAA